MCERCEYGCALCVLGVNIGVDVGGGGGAHVGGHVCVYQDLRQCCSRQGLPRFDQHGFGSGRPLPLCGL